ncbi:hypothetical protein BH09PSE4_BH09PSE4_15420 [soil metagenome]
MPAVAALLLAVQAAPPLPRPSLIEPANPGPYAVFFTGSRDLYSPEVREIAARIVDMGRRFPDAALTLCAIRRIGEGPRTEASSRRVRMLRNLFERRGLHHVVAGDPRQCRGVVERPATGVFVMLGPRADR